MPSPSLDSTHGRQIWAWHDITAFRQHTRWNYVGHGMPSSPLGSTHDQMMSGVACHHLPRTANTVEQRRGLHAITAFGQHTQSDDVERAMQSSHLGSTDRQTASGVASHHRPWTAQIVGRRRAWNAIIALGQHTRSAMSGKALNHCPWTVHTVK